MQTTEKKKRRQREERSRGTGKCIQVGNENYVVKASGQIYEKRKVTMTTHRRIKPYPGAPIVYAGPAEDSETLRLSGPPGDSD
jgi:hypothetical protein